MPQSRKKQDNAAALQKRAKHTATVSVPSRDRELPRSQSQEGEERKPSPLYILLVFPILFLVALNSLVTFLYVRALDPLYGSVPVDLHLERVAWAATIAGAFGPAPSLWPSLAVLGVWIASIPFSSYWTALYTGRIDNPAIGSTATHIIVLFPVLYLGVSTVKRITAIFEGYSSGNTNARFMVPVACGTSITGLRLVWPSLIDSYCFGYSGSDILRMIGGVFIALYVFRPTPASTLTRIMKRNGNEPLPPVSSNWFLTRLVVLALSALLWLLRPPLLAHPMTGPYTHPNFPLRILSSVPSVTGIIVVGETLPYDTGVAGTPESHPTSLRYLRASHSILGGFWIGDKVSTRASGGAPLLDSESTPLGDPIFSAFVLQEAVRLIDTTDRAIQPGQEKALFIGLGTGAAVTSFAGQNIDSTVIEIDPAVYNASRQYFGLPDLSSDRVFLNDARTVVAEMRASALQHGVSDADKYDYVVHDCFSGGVVPAHLFTLQFWEDLKTIMNPDGVVAVNFAGRMNSDPARAILATLQTSFGQCRVLHDLPTHQPNMINTFVNLVFFCSPSTKPLPFRSPTEKDYAGSHLRASIFDTLQEREVDMKFIRGDVMGGGNWVLDDTRNRLMDWQKEEAMEHWRTMRRVFPEPLWATY
ncbi:hypothetical protein F5148DRAFT_294350 [Russula earlei]|uniref:Uncharacterized protein n=1 Tax=Russula earlei TaxID=71964 RepID=A0ACC0UNS8_9AGAM|nr:hypothetical protein F5148DRAFT_294350 [Russula earlei]